MSVPGIGIDIAEVKRFRRLSGRFLKRVYTDEEVAYCRRSVDPAMHFAARFAAKEAVIKATTKTDIALKDIYVKNRASGAPEVFIKGKKKKFHISISHTKDIAVAVVISL
ncbi:holo-[acyl-carrier-protein] synthase [bacterium]|nr:holo-[acyl-carrier-protein] synthase [bacterium]